MYDLTNINKRQVAVSEYTDLKNHVHKVIHSVVFSDEEKFLMEEKIVDDLFRIFAKKGL